MRKSIENLRRFLNGVAADPRLPARDKAVITALLVYLAMPFDLIPDWIPVLGYLDDALVAVLIVDYLFHVVPEPVLLEHFPWGPEKYRNARRWVGRVRWMVPGFVRNRLWKAARIESAGE